MLTAFEDRRRAQAWQARLQFRLNPGQTEEAEEAVNQVIRSLIPWAAKEDDLGGGTDRINHMIADWFRFFAGDQLPDLLAKHRDRKGQ